MIRVFRASDRSHFDQARDLIAEYAESLRFDLAFQGFAQEMSSFPGAYGPPTGCVLLAEHGEVIVGCVAVRKLERDICEMKRLFVRPDARGGGIGRALVEGVINEARKLGYRRMRLDTVPSMKAARALYRGFGFKEIDPYR